AVGHIRLRGTLRRAALGGRINDAIALRIFEVAARRPPFAAGDELRLAGSEVHRVLLIATGGRHRRLINDLPSIRTEIRLSVFAAERELTDVFEVLLTLECF